MIFDVTKNGIVSSSKKIQTTEVQKLVDLASKKHGTIYFPKGTYVLGTIFLKSNTKIKLDEKALILGAPSFYDYAPQERRDFPIYQDASHTYFNCSMFVGENVKNISFTGKGKIDMRSVWDEDNIRNLVHRGPKCIALRNCKNIEIKGIKIENVTDLAIYFAGCDKVNIDDVKLKVYIDGISPDNSKNVKITKCYVESGEDGIVFKSSYTLNRLDICKNIKVKNCIIKSRCNSLKFGTETNGGFEKINISNCEVFDSRITGISVESVDGAKVKDIKFNNIKMNNVGSPFFVHIGKRMRGPKELKIGSIENVSFTNISVTGPYHVYNCMAWNYDSFVKNEVKQFPGIYSKGKVEKSGTWQITSNVCGLKGHNLKNIKFKNIYMELDGGVEAFEKKVRKEPNEYPEVNTYGRILPASAIYFRHIDGLILDNVNVVLIHPDKRPLFVFDCVNHKFIYNLNK